MKTWKSLLIMGSMVLASSGCYRKHLVFEAEAVSVTKKNSNGKKLKVGKSVERKWCRGEKPVFKSKSGDDKLVGLAEQGIFLAQGKGKQADFILEARVFTDTDGCVIVEGIQAKM